MTNGRDTVRADARARGSNAIVHTALLQVPGVLDGTRPHSVEVNASDFLRTFLKPQRAGVIPISRRESSPQTFSNWQSTAWIPVGWRGRPVLRKASGPK